MLICSPTHAYHTCLLFPQPLSCIEALLAELREDEHAGELLRLTREDADMGRMSWPIPVKEGGVKECLLCPRFAVRQSKTDGSIKLRAVDNLSWSAGWVKDRAAMKEWSVNGHAVPSEKLKHEALDELCSVLEAFVELTDHCPGLWKADIDAAFRRIPIRADQRWACGVAFRAHGKVCPLVQLWRFPHLRSGGL